MAALRPLTCPLCAAPHPRQWYHEAGYAYWRCGSCGLLFLWPQPAMDFLRDHYQDYLPVAPEQVTAWGQEMAPVIASAAGHLARLCPRPGRILDVGCGYGFFLETMARSGWQAQGVELSAPAAAIAQARPGLQVQHCRLEDARLEPGFDVISLFYVIEHLPDPLATLRLVRQLLAPQGLLLLRYPNTTPLLRLGPLARRLTLMQAPSHLYDFAGQSMARLLELAGFPGHETYMDAGTASPHLAKRLVSGYASGLAGVLRGLTRGRLLLPGVSRTTLASPSPHRLTRAM